ncbi:uncharacterized protein [Macaca nemestrina]|uniref:uncharacterized protein n=1 Tax=Macaca nemestrina TaxID=9545 RepID=UPI0039B9140F
MVWGVGSPGPEETQFWHCGHSVNDSTTGVSLGASLEEGDHRDISDRRDGIQALLTQRTDEPRCRKARLPSGEFLLANGRPQSESAPGQAPVPPALRSDAGPGLQQPYQPLQLTGGSGSLQLRFLSRSVLPIRYGLCLHHRLCNPFPVGESLLQRSEVSVFRLNLTRGKALTARWQEENSNTDHNTDGPGKHCSVKEVRHTRTMLYEGHIPAKRHKVTEWLPLSGGEKRWMAGTRREGNKYMKKNDPLRQCLAQHKCPGNRGPAAHVLGSRAGTSAGFLVKEVTLSS